MMRHQGRFVLMQKQSTEKLYHQEQKLSSLGKNFQIKQNNSRVHPQLAAHHSYGI
jgi:hypothetical protein